ncbi:MAG TPA: NAD-dependent epimerase/dehydratase family protein [Capillimicrobium sp.]|nr:NAD-dependent epimerase/dehydratase family protein [Capillimicrobium sp.]
MRVAVVGATGNVGSALVRALSADERVDEIVGIARRAPDLQQPKTTWRTADVVTDDLAPVLAGADVVVHLAWLIQPSRDERTTHAVNVQGSARVFRAAARAGVGAIVYASSVGAYSPGPKDRAVDESWPTEGIGSSFYSRHKAAVERILDSFEAAHPDVRVARLRPGLIFQREAASEIRRLFAGPLLPGPLLRRGLIPVVPRHPRLRFQAVHAHDIADAYRLAVVDPGARGAYNVAAEPVLDGEALARLLGARTVPVPGWLLRGGADLSWRARLQPTPAGWVDLGLGAPIMDTSRARTELGWTPAHTSEEAFRDLFDGMREGAGLPTPPLAPQAGGPARVGELLTGIGARNP